MFLVIVTEKGGKDELSEDDSSHPIGGQTKLKEKGQEGEESGEDESGCNFGTIKDAGDVMK